MRTLLLALATILGLFIFSSPAAAQTRLADWSPTQEPAQQIPAGWDYNPNVQFTTQLCTTAGGIWAPSRNGRVLVCWLPRREDGQLMTPWSESVTPEPVRRYAVTSAPQGTLPRRLCGFVARAQACRPGELWYREVMAEHGPDEGRYVLLEMIEDQYVSCGGIPPAERPRERARTRSRHGFSYYGRSGGLATRHSYTSTYEARPETDSERLYAIDRPRVEQAEHHCRGFMDEYDDHDGFRSALGF